MKLSKDTASGLNVCLEDAHHALTKVGVESSITKGIFSEGDEFTADDLEQLENVKSQLTDLGAWFGDVIDAIEKEQPSNRTEAEE